MKTSIMMTSAFDLVPTGIVMPNLYDTEYIKTPEKIARIKLFCPYSNMTCYLLEYNRDERVGFAVMTMDGFEWEFTYVSIQELEEIYFLPGVKAIERDLFFSETPLRDIEELGDFIGER